MKLIFNRPLWSYLSISNTRLKIVTDRRYGRILDVRLYCLPIVYASAMGFQSNSEFHRRQ